MQKMWDPLWGGWVPDGWLGWGPDPLFGGDKLLMTTRLIFPKVFFAVLVPQTSPQKLMMKSCSSPHPSEIHNVLSALKAVRSLWKRRHCISQTHLATGPFPCRVVMRDPSLGNGVLAESQLGTACLYENGLTTQWLFPASLWESQTLGASTFQVLFWPQNPFRISK